MSRSVDIDMYCRYFSRLFQRLRLATESITVFPQFISIMPPKRKVQEDQQASKAKTARPRTTRNKKTIEDDLQAEDTNDIVEEPPKKKVTKKGNLEEPKRKTTRATAHTTKIKKTDVEASKDLKAEETDEEVEPPKKATKRAPAKEDVKKLKNPTTNEWENINFDCQKKNGKGEVYNKKITSWNVDGIRAWLKKGGLEILEHVKPDMLCLQETKCSENKLPEELSEVNGYHAYWCSSDKEGYAGVGVLSKEKPLKVQYGIGDDDDSTEGRCITLEYSKFYLVNVYVPNAGRGLVTLPKRLDWNLSFKKYIKELDNKKPVILCGDMNVAHEEIDLTNPKTNSKSAGFTQEERSGMTDFLTAGFIDSFRKLYPDLAGVYTFWSYMRQARSKNIGWRLDYFIVSKRIMDNVCDNIVHSEVFGSDHCPLTLYVKI